MLRDQVEDTSQRGAAATAAEQTEVKLIVRVAAHDLRAFEELYRTYHGRLTRFLQRLTRRRDAFVEELLNDTMLVVWKRADSYNGRSKVSTWIFAIAYRKALKAWRRVDDPIEDHEAEQHASADPGPEQQLEQRQLSNVLGCALRELTPEHRAVIELTYFQGAGYSEIAQIVGCPVDTVKTRMFHARRRLRALLTGELGDWL